MAVLVYDHLLVDPPIEHVIDGRGTTRGERNSQVSQISASSGAVRGSTAGCDDAVK